MNLVVFSHKPCWRSSASPSGFATDGGFPFQIRALAEIFDRTVVVVPVSATGSNSAEAPLAGQNLTVTPVQPIGGSGFRRRLGLLPWLLRNGPVLLREARRADAVHAPIPGDIGTFGMLLAFFLRKPLFVRHCGNWLKPRTAAEHFWRWFMERFAGNRNVMLATGGSPDGPSRNGRVHWIFSTSLRAKDLDCAPRDFSRSMPVRLVIACRQEKLKGTGRVIETLPQILREFPDVTLEVAGDGAALPEFQTLAKRLHVDKQVVFHGRLKHDRLLELLRESTLFCYPTAASEGFPKVVLEALAAGLPVITTRISVLPELIGAGCGVLIDDDSPESIASAVQYCLDPDRYREMSRRAIATARNYSLERWRDTIASHLREAWGPLTRAV